MAYLALVRHGQSEWNVKNWWTGLTDIGLTEIGIQEAKSAGEHVKDIPFDIAFTSVLLRAKETWRQMQTEILTKEILTVENAALNERDYGDLTGKDKWKIREEYGEEQFLKWRRGWDTPPPNGESLKDVYSRLIPYFESTIVPQLKEEKNVIIVAHGNSLRALVKYLENISDEIIPSLEIATGEIYLYQIDKDGKVISKEIRKAANLHIPTKI
jgi:2,3-bisphosphoglycerate-dependent phosphoglycerate mutase